MDLLMLQRCDAVRRSCDATQLRHCSDRSGWTAPQTRRARRALRGAAGRLIMSASLSHSHTCELSALACIVRMHHRACFCPPLTNNARNLSPLPIGMFNPLVRRLRPLLQLRPNKGGRSNQGTGRALPFQTHHLSLLGIGWSTASSTSQRSPQNCQFPLPLANHTSNPYAHPALRQFSSFLIALPGFYNRSSVFLLFARIVAN